MTTLEGFFFLKKKKYSFRIKLCYYLFSKATFPRQQNKKVPCRGFFLKAGRAKKVYSCREKETKKVTVYLEDSDKRSHHLGSQSL